MPFHPSQPATSAVPPPSSPYANSHSRNSPPGPYSLVLGLEATVGCSARQAHRSPDCRQMIEVRIGGFEIGSVPEGAGSDQDIRCRNRHSPAPRAGPQLVRHGPDLPVDRQLRHHASEFPQYLAFAGTSGAVPEFELDQRAPASLSVRQRRFNACLNIAVAIRPKHVNPGGRVDEDQHTEYHTTALIFQPQRHPSHVTRPPATVLSTGIPLIPSGSASCGSDASTTKSASLPTVTEPLMSSSKDA